jgi:alkylhydroperoxidase family enzyme
MIEEGDAVGQVAEIFAEIKRELQLPIVPNMDKALAVSPAALAIHWGFTRSFFEHTTIPESLTAMILYTIAETGNCEYCSASNELTCRTLGIDEETLSALVEDLGNVSPQRIAAIVEFAVKASHDPQGLVARDYEKVREQGITDEELVEITHIAAIGTYLDTLADALKVEVEPMVSDALGR